MTKKNQNKTGDKDQTMGCGVDLGDFRWGEGAAGALG